MGLGPQSNNSAAPRQLLRKHQFRRAAPGMGAKHVDWDPAAAATRQPPQHLQAPQSLPYIKTHCRTCRRTQMHLTQVCLLAVLHKDIIHAGAGNARSP